MLPYYDLFGMNGSAWFNVNLLIRKCPLLSEYTKVIVWDKKASLIHEVRIFNFVLNRECPLSEVPLYH